ncbi:hypothetical protein L7F22_034241 [Adiantum nelumboides]|nr:hypothetical protein [Adiantum nelumboides]
MVFAHYMLYSFLYSNDVAGFTREIALAKAYGIDGFALNTGVWNDVYQTFADYLNQVCAANDFKLFFSADMNGTLILAHIKTMLTCYAAYSSQLKVNASNSSLPLPAAPPPSPLTQMLSAVGAMGFSSAQTEATILCPYKKESSATLAATGSDLCEKKLRR